MTLDSMSFLGAIAAEFKEAKIEEFSPISVWFSYGSNLFAPDFERKMKEHGSFLSLLQARPGRLRGWKRELNNKSKTRGLAYSIKENVEEKPSEVFGIVHDIPIADLSAFLQFEGILDRNSKLREIDKSRAYDVRRVSVELREPRTTVQCYTLEGISIANETERYQRIAERRKDLAVYVRTAMKGAVGFGIDISEFQKDLKEVVSAFVAL